MKIKKITKPNDLHHWKASTEPGFDVSIYFDLGARIFSTQRPPYVAHILQGLVDNRLHIIFL